MTGHRQGSLSLLWLWHCCFIKTIESRRSNPPKEPTRDNREKKEDGSAGTFLDKGPRIRSVDGGCGCGCGSGGGGVGRACVTTNTSYWPVLMAMTQVPTDASKGQRVEVYTISSRYAINQGISHSNQRTRSTEAPLRYLVARQRQHNL